MQVGKVKIALLFAFSWILLKYLFYTLHFFQDDILIPGLINNLFLILAIALGLYYEKKKEGFGKGTAFSDLKAAVTSGMIYTLLIAGFIFVYYQYIQPEFIETRIEERMDLLYSEMERPSYIDSLRNDNESFSMMTDEEIIRNIKDNTVTNLSPKSSFIFTLLGMMILTFSYGIFITIIYQRILFREYYVKK